MQSENLFTHRLKQIGFAVNSKDELAEAHVDQMLEYITHKYNKVL